MADSHLTRRFEVVVHYDLNMNEILKMSMAKVSGGFLCRESSRYPYLMVIEREDKFTSPIFSEALYIRGV